MRLHGAGPPSPAETSVSPSAPVCPYCYAEVEVPEEERDTLRRCPGCLRFFVTGVPRPPWLPRPPGTPPPVAPEPAPPPPTPAVPEPPAPPTRLPGPPTSPRPPRQHRLA